MQPIENQKTTVKERLLLYLKFKKITPAQFYRDTGLANGYIRSIKKSIGEDSLVAIEKAYPELNKVWLIFNEGEMEKKYVFDSSGNLEESQQDLYSKSKEITVDVPNKSHVVSEVEYPIPKTTLEAVFQLVANNSKLVDNAVRLTRMVDEKSATENVSQENLQAVLTKQNAFQELIFDLLHSKFPDLSVEEQKAALGNRLGKMIGAI